MHCSICAFFDQTNQRADDELLCYLSMYVCMQGILEVIFDTVSSLLRGQVDKRTMLDNLELVLLTIDEAVRSQLYSRQ